MSIFAGDFKDPQGVPFDPHSYAHAGTGDSQVMQRRYFTNTNKVWLVALTRTLRDCAGYWKELLDDEDRAIWKVAATHAWWHRDYAANIVGLGYVAMTKANFVLNYFGWGSFGVWPVGERSPAIAARVELIDTVNQHVRIEVTYQDHPGLDERAVTAVYQIDPKRVKSRRRERFTRLMLLHNEYVEGVWVYLMDADVRWPFIVGEELFFLVRDLRGFYHREGLVISGFAP